MLPRIFIFIFCLVSADLSAQVTNGGFENNTSLPTILGQWQVVQGWNNCGSLSASPDYFHVNGTIATNLPETPMAIVNPFQGNAIMGMIACGRPGTNYREYLQTEFSAPLQIGKQYLVSFKITNGIKTSVSLSGLGVNKLGILFTTGQPAQSGQLPIAAAPQLVYDPVLYNADWQSINFIFTADQPYSNMTFGLFGDDSDKNISVIEGADPSFAYYFVDNFVVQDVLEVPESGGGEKEPVDKPSVGNGHTLQADEPFYVPNTFTPNGDGDNELFKPITTVLKEWEFEIFSKWGDRVFFTSDETRGWDGTFNSHVCENGSYVWQMSYTVYDDEFHPRVVETRGIVNLVR